MKQILFTILFFYTIDSFGQLSIGPEIGGSFSKINPKTVSGQALTFDERRKAGFRIGAQVTFELSSKKTIQSGVYFIQKGYRSIFQNNGSLKGDALRLYYLELPLTFKYSIFSFGKTKLSLLGGGYCSTLLSARYIQDFGDYKFVFDKNRRTNIDQKTDVGFIIGISSANDLVNGKLQTTLQFEGGVLNIFNESVYASTHNNCLSLSVSYLLGLKKKDKN